jgi:hypothetical protein
MMDASNIYIQMDAGMLQLVYIYNYSIYASYYNDVPKCMKNKVLHMKTLLRTSDAVMEFDGRKIILVIPGIGINDDDICINLYNMDNATLNIVAGDTYSPPILKRVEMIEYPAASPKKYVFTYKYGVFGSDYADGNGKLLRGIRLLSLISEGYDEKNEIHTKISESSNWIDALNASYEINLIRNEEDVMSAIMKWLGNNNMMIYPRMSRVGYFPIGTSYVLEEFSITFSRCKMKGQLSSDVETAFYDDYTAVNLEDIEGWREKDMFLMYSR